MKSKVVFNLVTLFWFLKFIFDMFYMQKIFTISITLFALLLFVLGLKNNKSSFKSTDFFVILMTILFTLSFFKSTNLYIDYLKIISAFILYFLGRLLFSEEENIEKAVTVSLTIVFIINLIICIIGKGSITWGSANTLKGVYYFKTDFACMLSYFLTFWLFNYNKNKIIRFIIVLITLFLVLLTNARIYYLICMLIIILYFFYKKNIKIFSLKTISTLILSLVVVVFGLSLMSNVPFFRERNMISIKFNSLSDLYDSSNTQGRNEVWSVLLYNFNKQSAITRTFGTGLDFYQEHSYMGYSEHSTYIKVLLNTGYVGIVIFILFIISAVFSILKVSNSKTRYLIFILLAIFLIAGISSPTILYVNTSWLPMFYIGLGVSNVAFTNMKGNNNEEKTK